MRKRVVFPLYFTMLLLIFITGCAPNAPSTFEPKGTAASSILELWWMMFGLGTAVYIIVMGLIFWGLRRNPESVQGLNGRRFVILGGFAIPIIILTIVYGYTLTTLNALAPERNQGEYTVEVIGYQWWWEVRYPDQSVITANEIHIPTGQPVNFKLTSADVIHSFWVPELHGKHDLIPGRVNDFWLQAEEPGAYWGLCAEFCGTQHAKMLLVVVAEPPDEFEQWLQSQQETAVDPQSALTAQGFDIFMEYNCDNCHRIAGTDAAGDLGPDLTHFASRQTLGAGAVLNTPENLAQWIRNPHTIKPGNLMPAINLTEEELTALLAYLESLE